jgi:hypothetical protein
MELYKQETKYEPFIMFNEGVLIIKGRSIPADSTALFNPVIECFYDYSKNPLPRTEINIQLDYINSSSNRSIMNILIIAESIYTKGNEVIVNWFYEEADEMILDQGSIFQSLIKIPFNIQESKRE